MEQLILCFRRYIKMKKKGIIVIMKEYIFSFKKRGIYIPYITNNTNLKLINNYLNVVSNDEKNGNFKFISSYFKGKIDINIYEISSIEFKIGYAFSYKDIFFGLFSIFVYLFSIVLYIIIIFSININFEILNELYQYKWLEDIGGINLILIICNTLIYSIKCIQITWKNDDDAIQSSNGYHNKKEKICLPISCIFF